MHRSTRCLSAAAAALLLGASAPAHIMAQQARSTCRPRDVHGEVVLSWMLTILPGDDAWGTEARANLRLPQTPASRISYVVDDRVCARAATAFSAAFGQPSDSPRAMVVVKVGDYYIAEDPAYSPDGMSPGVVLDGRFDLVMRYTS